MIRHENSLFSVKIMKKAKVQPKRIKFKEFVDEVFKREEYREEAIIRLS